MEGRGKAEAGRWRDETECLSHAAGRASPVVNLGGKEANRLER